jgi:hypothetical protein
MQEKGTIPAPSLESGPTTHGTVANHESTVSPRQAHVQEAAQVTLEAEHEKSTIDCQHPMSARQRALVAGHLPGFEQEFKFKLSKNLSPSPMCKLDPMSLEATMPLSRAELSRPSLTTPTLEEVSFAHAAHQGMSVQSAPLYSGQGAPDHVVPSSPG